MTNDRRDDVGTKIVTGVLISVIAYASVSFISAAWAVAYDGKKKADSLGERMIAMEVRFSSFQSDLAEIKDLLKRSVKSGERS